LGILPQISFFLRNSTCSFYEARPAGLTRYRVGQNAIKFFAFLTSQEKVNKTLVGILGGSCSVNQAIQAARRHPEIRTLVLLSGGTDSDGETFIKSAAKTPIFGGAREEDTTALHQSRRS
jgi:dienelactone hydrolase